MDLKTLPVQQLLQVRQSLDRDVQTLQMSAQQLQQLLQTFSENISILNADMTSALIPLTNSIHVQGTIGEKVMVDVGTGYFIQCSHTYAQEIYKRRIEYVQENLKPLMTDLEEKQKQLLVLTQVIQARVKESESAKQ
eukprot:NODE_24_length_41419_cov_0.818780.p30 type:complete len:137 gc:universal NODE_24_length_41419_cov_0.818780:39347-38937(-)